MISLQSNSSKARKHCICKLYAMARWSSTQTHALPYTWPTSWLRTSHALRLHSSSGAAASQCALAQCRQEQRGKLPRSSTACPLFQLPCIFL